MRNLIVTAVLLLASCASDPSLGLPTSVVLRGIPGNATCLTPRPYSDTFPVLKLAEPIRFGSNRNVKQVELIMDEPLFVQFGQFIGKPSIVSCRLSESSLCGYPQVSCGASSIKIEP